MPNRLVLTAAILGSVSFPIPGNAQAIHGWALSDAAAQEYVLDVWTVDDGLPQSSVNDIVQTQDGYLWLATFGGLARFDGVRFQVFDGTTSLGLSGNRVVSLHEDSRGALWIGFERSGIGRLIDGRFEAFQSPDSQPVGTVWDIDEDAAGNVWFAASNGFIVYSDSTWLRWADVAVLPLGRPSIYSDAETLWLGFGNDQLARVEIDESGFSRLDTLIDLSGAAALKVHRDKNGRIWVGTNRGVLAADEDGIFVPQTSLPWSVQEIVEGRLGKLWFLGEEVLRFNLAGSRNASPEDMPPTRPLGTGLSFFARSGAVDREGNVWIGTQGGGLLRLRPRPIKRYQPYQTTSASVWSLAAGDAGVLWVSMQCGRAALRFQDGRFEQSNPPGPQMCNESMAVDGDGSLWVPRGSLGLRRLTASGVQTISSEPVHAVFADPSRTVWMRTARSLMSWAGDSLVTHFSLDDEADTLPGGDLLVTADGSAWFAGESQLARWKGGGGLLERYSPSDGLPEGDIRALHHDEDGVLWVGSYGRGLARFEEGNFFRYTVEDGLADNFVLQILEDDDGNLWLNGNRVLSYIPRTQLNMYARGEINRIHPVVFGRRDGFAEGNSSQRGAVKSPDGRLWFSSIDGIMMVDPANRVANGLPPPVKIEMFSAADSIYSLGDIRLAPRTRDLEFRYTALSLGRPENVRFRYMLEGYDDDWVEAGNRRTAFYSGVPPGQYVFTVIASNDEGVWNETGDSLQFVVLPSFWVTWWFRAAGVAAVSWLLFMAYQVRTRSIRGHARELQAEINEQRRLEREVLEISAREQRRIGQDLHDGLGQHLTGIAFLSKALAQQLAVESSPKAADAVEIEKLVNETIKQARNLAKGLHPTALVTGGLGVALEELASATEQLFDVSCVLAADRAAALPDDVATQLYYVAQEAVTNAVKHGEASNITLELRAAGDTTTLVVEDDGRGFPADGEGAQGMGLQIMRYRVRMIDASLDIRPRPGGGTVVLCSFPTPPTEEGEP